MAFLFPIGETILSAVEAGAAGNMMNAVYNEFKEPAKKLITDEAGQLIGDYAKAHEGGYVDNIVQKSYIHRKKRQRRVG
jgi:hypothetical protein